MKNIVSLIILFFLLIVYVYSIAFQVFPISLKIILELIGALYCIPFFHNSKYIFRREYKIIILLLLLLVVWDIMTSSYNGHFEFHLSLIGVKTIGSIFAAHFIYIIAPHFARSIKNFCFVLVAVIAAESLLTLIMKIFPPIYNLMEAILVFDFGGFEMEDIFDVARFVGIGTAKFFGVLPSCAIGLMTIVYLIRVTDSIFAKMFLFVLWVLIFVVSFFTARYSMVIAAISIVYFLYSGDRKHLFKNLFVICLGWLILLYVYTVVIASADDNLVTWAFGFINGEGKDDPTDTLKSWWFDTTFDLDTLLIGDARYKGINGQGYYMTVDVGILRQIYYGGLIGLFLSFYVHFKILKYSYKSFPELQYKYLLSFLFLSLLATLTKGDTDMMSYFILYLVVSTGGVFNHKRIKHA